MSSSPSSRTSNATWCQSGRPSESVRSWTSTLPAFEVLTRQKIPPPPRRQAATNGSSESWPRYVFHGQGVRHRRTVRRGLEVRVRVGARGRADVPAFAVDNHEQAGLARVGCDPLERGDAVAAEDLEERELGLDADAVGRDRVDDPAAEPLGRVGGGGPSDLGVAAELEREQIEPRVEPDDQLAPLLVDRRDDTIGEGSRGPHPLDRRRVRPEARLGGGRRLSLGPALPYPPRTVCFSELPAVNFGTVAAGICTFSPGLRGSRPSAPCGRRSRTSRIL